MSQELLVKIDGVRQFLTVSELHEALIVREKKSSKPMTLPPLEEFEGVYAKDWIQDTFNYSVEDPTSMLDQLKTAVSNYQTYWARAEAAKVERQVLTRALALSDAELDEVLQAADLSALQLYRRLESDDLLKKLKSSNKKRYEALLAAIASDLTATTDGKKVKTAKIVSNIRKKAKDKKQLNLEESSWMGEDDALRKIADGMARVRKNSKPVTLTDRQALEEYDASIDLDELYKRREEHNNYWKDYFQTSPAAVLNYV